MIYFYILDIIYIYIYIYIICCIYKCITSQKLGSGDVFNNSILDDSSITLPAYHSRNNLKLYNIHVTLKMARKVITNLDLAKAYVPDFILVVVLNKVELELSHVPAALFNMCLKESYFREC